MRRMLRGVCSPVLNALHIYQAAGALRERTCNPETESKRLPLRTSANLIRYNSCDRGVRHACGKARMESENGKDNA